MDDPGVYYANENSQTEKKKIILFYLYVESEKTKQKNKWNRNRLINTENKLMVGDMGKIGEGE